MLPSNPILLSLIVLWLVITAATIGLWIYRAVLGLREEDALFIDPGEEKLLKEQAELAARMEKIRPLLIAGASASALIGVGTIGYWIFVQLTTTPGG
jgi:hypothetical protein